MISLANLRDTQIRALADGLSRKQGVSEFVGAVKKFLKAVPVDHGADSDLIYMTGKRLADAGVWVHVPEVILGAAVHEAPKPAVDLFFETVPEYRTKVQNAVVVKAPAKPQEQKLGRSSWHSISKASLSTNMVKDVMIALKSSTDIPWGTVEHKPGGTISVVIQNPAKAALASGLKSHSRGEVVVEVKGRNPARLKPFAHKS